MNTTYGYDSLSRLLSVLHQNGATTLDGATYTYDNAGNRTAKTNQLNGVAEQYAYDPIYQLTQVTQGATTTESYTYDAVGNRLTSLGASSYSYNSSNELTSSSAATYTYDNNGNTLTKVASGNTTQYTWDFDNRLTSVVLPGTGGTATFKYDPFGRRIQKAFTQNSTTTTTNYVYDGPNSAEEFDQSGNLLARYMQNQGVDEPLSEVRSGTSSYYEQDGLGSVTSLSGSTGAVANTYVYDEFGNLSTSTGTLLNPFQYTGRDYDPETGLRYYRARYYDSTTGRFLNEDFLGFGGGNNFYSYVANNPIGYIDPAGLALTPAQCSELYLRIQVNIMNLEDRLKKYDPIEDGKGGHPYSAGGQINYTQPGIHYTMILMLQARLWMDIATYQRECGGGPKIPCDKYEIIGRKIPEPVYPRVTIPVIDPIAKWLRERAEEIWITIKNGPPQQNTPWGPMPVSTTPVTAIP